MSESSCEWRTTWGVSCEMGDGGVGGVAQTLRVRARARGNGHRNGHRKFCKATHTAQGTGRTYDASVFGPCGRGRWLEVSTSLEDALSVACGADCKQVRAARLYTQYRKE